MSGLLDLLAYEVLGHAQFLHEGHVQHLGHVLVGCVFLGEKCQLFDGVYLCSCFLVGAWLFLAGVVFCKLESGQQSKAGH